MKLNEITRQPLPQEVAEYFAKYFTGCGYTYDGRNLVMHGSMVFSVNTPAPPFKITHIEGHLLVRATMNSDTWKNLPLAVESTISISGDNTSEQLTRYAPLNAKSLIYQPTTAESFAGIHKTRFSKIRLDRLTVAANVTNVLGLCLIDGITTLGVVPVGNHLISSFDLSHRDVHRLQEELLDAGFAEQAKL